MKNHTMSSYHNIPYLQKLSYKQMYECCKKTQYNYVHMSECTHTHIQCFLTSFNSMVALECVSRNLDFQGLDGEKGWLWGESWRDHCLLASLLSADQPLTNAWDRCATCAMLLLPAADVTPSNVHTLHDAPYHDTIPYTIPWYFFTNHTMSGHIIPVCSLKRHTFNSTMLVGAFSMLVLV